MEAPEPSLVGTLGHNYQEPDFDPAQDTDTAMNEITLLGLSQGR